MRSLRYLCMVLLVATTLTTAAKPQESPSDEPRFRDRGVMTKLLRIVRLIVQPLGDGIVPPHP